VACSFSFHFEFNRTERLFLLFNNSIQNGSNSAARIPYFRSLRPGLARLHIWEHAWSLSLCVPISGFSSQLVEGF